MRAGDAHRFALTPTGAGVLSLFLPGVVVAAVLRHPLLMAVSIGAGLALLVNTVAARYLVGSLAISVRGPVTATVGEPCPVTVGLDRRRPLECLVAVTGGVRSWHAALAPDRGEVLVGFEERGVVERIGIRVQTSAPLGLLACVRSATVGLDGPIHVGPRRVEIALQGQASGGRALLSPSGDEASGLRPYVVGDSPRDIHWPAVARTGQMIVRERTETLDRGELEVVVDSSDSVSGPDFDALLGRARSALEQLLVAGWQVRLTVADGSETDAGIGSVPIASADEVIVRLARAIAGPLPPVGRAEGLGCLVLDAEGHRWRSIS